MIELEYDLSDVEAKCEEGQAHQVRVAQRAPETAAKVGVERAQARRRYKNRTGNLTFEAVGRPVTTNPTGGTAEMVWPVSYASYVNDGTKAHDILPKLGAGFIGPPQPGQGRRSRGKGRVMLAFNVGGHMAFARRVRHPGTQPYAFADEAALQAQHTLVHEVEVGVAELEKILSR
jgi:hypothetical protein